ncbi:NAD(P)/FAD-dependent oxidoreductase [Psychrobacillus sp. NPDC093180]|uniref:NAD(P)/FAD-dependent oxidoreductase n=1 Tax=Psychrobacillus sp. NPDC093180 TaxID=3364489 RepID=UPI0038259A13
MISDVVIIGAGPAGLSAAIDIAKSGASVIIVDEYYRPGGRLLGQHYDDLTLKGPNKLWDGQQIAQKLTEEARALGVKVLCGMTVWSIEGKWEIKLSGGDISSIYCKALLVATGAAEHALPCPGWTLPGVYSIGAAQTFTNVHHVALGKRVFVIGADPLSLSVVLEMKKAGIEVIGVALPPKSPLIERNLFSPTENVKRLTSASHLAPNLMLQKLGKLVSGRLSKMATHILALDFLKVEGIPLYLRKSLVCINGKEQVESVTLQNVDVDGNPNGKEIELAVDAICLSAGLYPLIDLLQAIGCPLIDIKELGGLVPLHSVDMSTSIPGLFVAGNITGIEGAKVAIAQGKMAGLSILIYLQKPSKLTKEEGIEEIRRARIQSPIKFIPEIEVGRRKMEKSWTVFQQKQEVIS